MSNFKGYFLKFGDTVFPHKYLAQGAESTPFQRTESTAYRDANNDLHRITIPNHKSKFEITTIPDITLEQKIEIENVMNRGLQNVNERKYLIEYWNDDIGVNDYSTGYFYIPNPTFKWQKITDNTIIYDALTYKFIEY
ncbi:MAG: hypothetical protein II931_01425 [Clostridia bacterium]|nr:hypothetical protein [Clostridia bacterium]